MKRVLCIHDLSCVGRASLGVIAPVLSAMGVQACCLPTALLSTHTGGFGAPAHADTTAFAREALAHYAREGLAFDAVYSGYLANAAAAAVVRAAHAQYPNAMRIVDPAMGDGGALYSGLDAEVQAQMAQLCRHADVIVPNATEAQLLLESTAAELPCKPAALAEALRKRCDAAVVVTGLGGANAWAGANGSGALPYGDTGVRFPGTGDLFAAVLTGALLRGAALPAAVQLAASFVEAAARRTLAKDAREGVQFEPLLGRLAQESEAFAHA